MRLRSFTLTVSAIIALAAPAAAQSSVTAPKKPAPAEFSTKSEVDPGPVKHAMKGYTFMYVPANGSTADFATITFKASINGTAVTFARGYCNISPEAAVTKEVNVEVRRVGTTPFTLPVAFWGVMRVPHNSSGALEQRGWSSVMQMPVIAGNTYNVVVSGKHASPAAGTSNCSGTMTVDIM